MCVSLTYVCSCSYVFELHKCLCACFFRRSIIGLRLALDGKRLAVSRQSVSRGQLARPIAVAVLCAVLFRRSHISFAGVRVFTQ